MQVTAQLAVDMQPILNFVYPLIFFLMGFGILLKNTAHSQFHLPASLNYLAWFGIIHSFADWGNFFIPMQSSTLGSVWTKTLQYLQVTIRSISFIFLLWFAVDLLIRSTSLSRKFVLVPLVAFTLWLAACGVAWFWSPGAPLLFIGYAACNYILTLPAGLIAGYAVLLQRRQFERLHQNWTNQILTCTAASIVAYTALVGLATLRIHRVFPAMPRALAAPQALAAPTLPGFPVELLRMLAGLLIFVFILRILHAVDIEYQQYFQAAERERALAERARALSEERTRIASDLHDGMIQSLYASGLLLESIRYALDKGDLRDPVQISQALSQVVGKANGLIGEIRAYIADLKQPAERRLNLFLALKDFVQEIRNSSDISVQLHFLYHGLEPPAAVTLQIFYVVKEALTNVMKHAHASQAIVEVSEEGEDLMVTVSDDGIGIENSQQATRDGFRLGIENMVYRAKMAHGYVQIQPMDHGGTKVALRIPKKLLEV